MPILQKYAPMFSICFMIPRADRTLQRRPAGALRLGIHASSGPGR